MDETYEYGVVSDCCTAEIKWGDICVSCGDHCEAVELESGTVSFDFDDTLSEKNCQDYARELIERGYDVLVHTQRPLMFFHDVYEVCKKIGIPYENVTFCGEVAKEYFLEDKDILFHLDNDPTIDDPRLVVFDENFIENCESKL